MYKNKLFWVTGAQGLLGSSIVRALRQKGVEKILQPERKTLDLTSQAAVDEFLEDHKPEIIIHCAARVGGIKANVTFPTEFLVENLQMQTNVMASAHKHNVQTLVSFGSNCMYPLAAPQPLKEESILTGPIEPTNLAYGAAKIAAYVGAKSYTEQFGRRYFCVIPASLYGPNDNYHAEYSHVAPALIRRFHEAKVTDQKEIVIWGTGNPRRELLYVDDAADGVLHMLENFNDKSCVINLGAGDDVSVKDLAYTIAKVVGFKGEIRFDTTRPDGNPRKLLDSDRAQRLGFKPRVSLQEGLQKTYQWLLETKTVRGFNVGD